MKAILIRDCLNCPLMDIEDGVLSCTSGSAVIRRSKEELVIGKLEEVGNDTPIPDWCPLDTLSEKIEHAVYGYNEPLNFSQYMTLSGLLKKWIRKLRHRW